MLSKYDIDDKCYFLESCSLRPFGPYTVCKQVVNSSDYSETVSVSFLFYDLLAKSPFTHDFLAHKKIISLNVLFRGGGGGIHI